MWVTHLLRLLLCNWIELVGWLVQSLNCINVIEVLCIKIINPVDNNNESNDISHAALQIIVINNIIDNNNYAIAFVLKWNNNSGNGLSTNAPAFFHSNLLLFSDSFFHFFFSAFLILWSYVIGRVQSIAEYAPFVFFHWNGILENNGNPFDASAFQYKNYNNNEFSHLMNECIWMTLL